MGELTAEKDRALSSLRYPVPGIILAGTRAGFKKMAGYPANRNRISGTSLVHRAVSNYWHCIIHT